jgi:polyribonucleotide nucleotidyltransferase
MHHGKYTGISVGLVVDPHLARVDPSTQDRAASESSNWVLLTDILGTEDYYGDMDCKVAGTEEGITAIQLDIKLPNGIPLLALEEALYKAKDGREHILETMNADIKVPRNNIKATAPLAVEIKFDPERKRHLIGKACIIFSVIISQTDLITLLDNGTLYLLLCFGRH